MTLDLLRTSSVPSLISQGSTLNRSQLLPDLTIHDYNQISMDTHKI